MRLNRYLAQATGLSRRAADRAIEAGQVQLNGVIAQLGQEVGEHDQVSFNGRVVTAPALEQTTTIMLNKPAGFVVSRNGQGSRTVYDILPAKLHHLKPIGRLDKYSSGLLLLTDDGKLAHELTHPSRQKIKRYEVELSQPLAPLHRQMIADFGVQLDDGLSRLGLERLRDDDNRAWLVQMSEGRNRQIRRTFASLGYTVARLHRTQFGPYHLDDLASGAFVPIDR